MPILTTVEAVSFDRAADFYDATRALPVDVHAQVTELLAAELSGRGLCLEIGVGTGRIALPLVDRGLSVVGIDISAKMLRRLALNAGGGRLPSCVADVGALPLWSGSVGAVMASHVLHLVPSWRAAVDEAVRVLRPGGVLLVDFGGAPASPWHEATVKVMGDVGVHRVRPGVSVPGPVEQHLAGRARPRPLTPLTLTVHRTLAQDLSDWANQVHSWTWSHTPAQMAEACQAVRRWAADTGWPLDRRVDLERTIQWWAFELTD